MNHQMPMTPQQQQHLHHQQQLYQMDNQNPTTSHPQWQQHPQQHPQQYGQPQQPPMTYQHPPAQLPHDRAQQFPRSPSRVVLPPAAPPNPNIANWMNQHYMNGPWAYSHQSPVPSIAPSVMSQSQYVDDRMSMLSVNTHGQGDAESQRCYSSNGSACENINPEMAYAQLWRDAEFVMQNWFNIRDMAKRYDLTAKLYAWVRNKGLEHLDGPTAERAIQTILAIITDGLILKSPPNPTPEFINLSTRLLEIFYKLVHNRIAIHTIVNVFSKTAPNGPNLKELICPFIPLMPNPPLQRCSFLVLESITYILQLRNADQLKIPFLKALKFPMFVQQLIRNLHDSECVNINVLIILRNLISRDPAIKEFLIRMKAERSQHLPESSLIRIILEKVLPRAVHQQQGAQHIVFQACFLLRNLLHDDNAMKDFIMSQGVSIVCHTIQQINDVRVVKEALNLFLHISDSAALNDVVVPLPFILSILNFFTEDPEIYSHGTGFLSNLVANKPRFKREAISNNAIPTLECILSKLPRFHDCKDERERRFACEILSNSLRTLINLLPFYAQHAAEDDEQRQRIMAASVAKLIEAASLQRCMSYLSCDVPQREVLNMVELRSYILRFLIIMVKMPFVHKNGFVDICDDLRKDNTIGHTIHVYSWTCRIYQEKVGNVAKEAREKLIDRALTLLTHIKENCPNGQRVGEQCRMNMGCPLDLIRDSRNEAFTLRILEFCEKISEEWEDITTVWNVDRAMLEGYTNSRNAMIAKYSNMLLSRMLVTSSEPLADVFANSDFYQ